MNGCLPPLPAASRHGQRLLHGERGADEAAARLPIAPLDHAIAVALVEGRAGEGSNDADEAVTAGRYRRLGPPQQRAADTATRRVRGDIEAFYLIVLEGTEAGERAMGSSRHDERLSAFIHRLHVALGHQPRSPALDL